MRNFSPAGHSLITSCPLATEDTLARLLRFKHETWTHDNGLQLLTLKEHPWEELALSGYVDGRDSNLQANHAAFFAQACYSCGKTLQDLSTDIVLCSETRPPSGFVLCMDSANLCEKYAARITHDQHVFISAPKLSICVYGIGRSVLPLFCWHF